MKTDKEIMQGMCDVINQHSATLKKMVTLLEKQQARIKDLESLTADQREKRDIFTATFMEEFMKGKKK